MLSISKCSIEDSDSSKFILGWSGNYRLRMSSQFNHSDSTEFDRNSIMGSWSFFGGCDIQSPVRHSSQLLNKKQKYIPWVRHCLTIAERGWTQSYLRTSELVKSEVTWCNLQEDMLCTQQSLYRPWKFGGPADQKRLASDRSNMNTMTVKGTEQFNVVPSTAQRGPFHTPKWFSVP